MQMRPEIESLKCLVSSFPCEKKGRRKRTKMLVVVTSSWVVGGGEGGREIIDDTGAWSNQRRLRGEGTGSFQYVLWGGNLCTSLQYIGSLPSSTY